MQNPLLTRTYQISTRHFTPCPDICSTRTVACPPPGRLSSADSAGLGRRRARAPSSACSARAESFPRPYRAGSFARAGRRRAPDSEGSGESSYTPASGAIVAENCGGTIRRTTTSEAGGCSTTSLTSLPIRTTASSAGSYSSGPRADQTVGRCGIRASPKLLLGTGDSRTPDLLESLAPNLPVPQTRRALQALLRV